MKRPWQIWSLFILCLAIVLPAMCWLTVKAFELDQQRLQSLAQAESARQKETEARKQAETARHQAEYARSTAELQERVSSALWRLDWTLTPVVAQEASRPYYVYHTLVPAAQPPNTLAMGATPPPVTTREPAPDNLADGGKPRKPESVSTGGSGFGGGGKGDTGGKVGTGGKGDTGGKGSIAPVLQAPSPLLMQPSPYVLLHFQIFPDGSWTSPQSPTGLAWQTAIDNGIASERIDTSNNRLGTLRSVVRREDIIKQLPKEILPQVALRPDWGSLSFNYTGNPLNWRGANAVQVTNPAATYGVEQNPAYLPPDRNESRFDEAGDPDTISQSDTAPQAPSTYDPFSQQQAANAAPQQAEHHFAQPGSGQQAAPQSPPPQQAAGYEAQYAQTQRRQLRRGGDEYRVRNQAYQNFAQNQFMQQRLNTTNTAIPMQYVAEGVSRPLWAGSHLLLVRRVNVRDQLVVQGCWLNWPEIKKMLLAQIRDLLPAADLVPIAAGAPVQAGRALATLPVQIVTPEPEMKPLVFAAETTPAAVGGTVSPIRISLFTAWGCLLVAATAVGGLLLGVVTLSERRGAFVSAVTHELRTPLTTFRIYAEMLSEGMVTDPAKQQTYLETLRVEGDRLYHLVENVLAYARLERGRPGKRRETLETGALIDRVQTRLQDRAQQAGMQLVVDASDEARAQQVATDPAAVEQILFNLVDNASKYASAAGNRDIILRAEAHGREMRISVRDHGPGISVAQKRRLFRPFSKPVEEAAATAPGVGLGLALCKRLARALGGRLELDAQQEGATFVFSLPFAK